MLRLASLCVAALLLSACSDDDRSVENPLEAKLAQAAEASSGYGARFVFRGRFTEDGETSSFRGTGAVEAGGDRDVMSARAYGVRVTMYTDGPYVLMNANVFPASDELPPGTRWIKVDQEALAESRGLSGPALRRTQNLDPARQLETWLELASEVHDEGPDRVAGVRTTRYRVILEGEKLYERLTEGADDPPEPPDGLVDLEVPVGIWVDRQGLVRRAEMDAQVGDQGIEVTSQVTTLDRELRVDVPSGPDVFELEPPD